MEPISEIMEIRKKKASELMKMGIEIYPQPREKFMSTEEIKALGEKVTDSDDMGSGLSVKCAGRIVSFRDFGKSVFFHILDRKGKIQIYARKDYLENPEFSVFKKFDVGDIVGVYGVLFRTKTGELTILAKSINLLAKSYRPLPEKWHGLKDVEERYRKRYLDLISNERTREIFLKRARIIDFMREYLSKRDFLEVETPMMHIIPGGADAKPFVTHHNALDLDLYLRIAPELYLKRLVVGGFERVFEINRNFRNEGISVKHNPEFTMLEFYEAYATYEDHMELLQDLFFKLAIDLNGEGVVKFKGNNIDLTPPWKRYTLKEALKKVGGLGEDVLEHEEALRRKAIELGIEDQKDMTYGKLLLKTFEVLCEDKLIEPTFITEYPFDVSPLAKRKKDDPLVTDRFELYIGGLEIANGFNELNDPFDQRERFMIQAKKKGDLGLIDEDYLTALEYGMPPCAGCGIGIDRVVMIYTDSPSIREVILFPLLRP